MHSDLIAKLEALDGPSREVDAEILGSLDGEHNLITRYYDAVIGWDTINGLGVRNYGHPAPLTASIDAASALVERVLPGWSWEARRSGFGNGQASVWNPMEQPRPGTTIRADHKSSPAIALLIATLKALEARDG